MEKNLRVLVIWLLWEYLHELELLLWSRVFSFVLDLEQLRVACIRVGQLLEQLGIEYLGPNIAEGRQSIVVTFHQMEYVAALKHERVDNLILLIVLNVNYESEIRTNFSNTVQLL